MTADYPTPATELRGFAQSLFGMRRPARRHRPASTRPTTPTPTLRAYVRQLFNDDDTNH